MTMKWLKRGIILLVFLTLVGFAGAWFMRRGGGDISTYRTAKVTRGDVVSTIGATGVVQAQEVVDIGAQVAGQVAAFGTDLDGKPVDHRSRVKKGQMLAQIDDALYRSDVQVATAQIAAAKAGVQRAQADLQSATAKRNQAERDWTRAQKLGASEALAQVTYDNYQAVYESAVAAVAVADAAIAEANGSVAQAEANLFRAERNLGYTTISSPIDGQIIERRVNIGQTVVSSLNAPSLFLLAKDLSQLQVWVPVNEADVSQVHDGQPVTFTVEGDRDRVRKGSVRMVRPKAEMTQNVVTYLVEVSTDNADYSLKPYETADVQFEVARREGVLTVSNAALRFQPDPEKIVPDARETEESATKGRRGGVEGTGRSSTRPTSGPARNEMRRATIWIREGEFLRPIRVRAGLTDGNITEVTGEGLTEDMEVVTGAVRSDSTASAGNTNPFGPPQFGRGSGSGRRSGG